MLNLQTLPITQLNPAPYNPRLPLQPGTPGYERLKRSLEEFGLVQPIIWNEQSGHVVAGHQRLSILQHEGCTEVDVVVVSLTLEQEKALNVTLNNQQVGSDWDPEKLTELISELAELPNFDETLTGFDTEDIRHLLLAPDPKFTPDDEPGEPSQRIEIALSLDPADWDEFRPELDDLIAMWNLIVHVKPPSASQ